MMLNQCYENGSLSMGTPLLKRGARVPHSRGFWALDYKWGGVDSVVGLQNVVLREFTRQYLRVKPELRTKKRVQKEYHLKRQQPTAHQDGISWLGRGMARRGGWGVFSQLLEWKDWDLVEGLSGASSLGHSPPLLFHPLRFQTSGYHCLSSGIFNAAWKKFLPATLWWVILMT